MLLTRLPIDITTTACNTEDQDRRPIKNGRKPKSSGMDAPLSAEVVASIQTMIEETVRRLHIDPHAEAFSIPQFCARYGVSRTTAYEQIDGGWLKAKKPPGNRRTIVPKVEADRWLASAPLMKPGADKSADAMLQQDACADGGAND